MVVEGISYCFRPDTGTDFSESCVIELLQPKAKKLFIWTVYRAPENNLDVFIQDLHNYFQDILDASELLLLGDFNDNFLNFK